MEGEVIMIVKLRNGSVNGDFEFLYGVDEDGNRFIVMIEVEE